MSLNRFALFTLYFLVSASFPAAAQEKAYDYVIKNALVYDGEAMVPVRQDLAISGERIAGVGTISEEDAKEVIDAEGLVATPGFIDAHTHSDFNPFAYPNLGNKILQGVTTEVIGNCGMSAAPVEGPHRKEIATVWKREGVEIPNEVSWTSFGDYVSEIEFQGLETNFVGLVGHGNLRSSVLGMEPRQAQPEEIEAMKKLLVEALDKGASGISFGLVYLPGVFASREELVTLCRTAAERGGLCAFHIRSEGSGLIEAIEEALEIGREAGARIQISHLKATGKANWDKIQEAFQKIEEARAAGLEVTADAYPYEAGFAELGVVLPDKFYRDPKRVEHFRNPHLRQRILRNLKRRFETHPIFWDRVRIATVTTPQNQPFQGKTLAQISDETGKPPLEVLLDLLAEERFEVSAFYFSQSEAVINQVLSKPYVAIGSDSIADGSATPHPRAFGTFPKILAQCSKEGKAPDDLCWGPKIRQMTSLPAQIFGLRERGRIQPGFYADLVLFDPRTVRDTADYGNPKSSPEGIRWVFVNGKPAVREGRYKPLHTGLFVTTEK